MPSGIAPETGNGTRWGEILSVDDCGNPVVSPHEEIMARNSGLETPGIAPQTPQKLIG